MHPILHFNYWAILVAAAILFVSGAVWYSFLFAKPWMALTGHVKGSRPKGAVTAMICSFVTDLLLAFVLAHVVYWSGHDSFAGGAFLGVLGWLGFVVPPALAETQFEGRPYKLFAINAGFWLVGLLLAGGVLAVWR